jgi:hypothetical protein
LFSFSINENSHLIFLFAPIALLCRSLDENAMKLSLLLLLPAGLAAGFTVPTPARTNSLAPLRMEQQPGGYIPGGFTPEKWAAFRGAEKREHSKRRPHFQSRSLVDYQRDLEAGKVNA